CDLRMPSAETFLQRALASSVEPPADELSERILDAAVEIWAASGVKNLTMDEVADRAGVGRMTVYRRFGSPEPLAEARAAGRGAPLPGRDRLDRRPRGAGPRPDRPGPAHHPAVDPRASSARADVAGGAGGGPDRAAGRRDSGVRDEPRVHGVADPRGPAGGHRR